MFIGIIGLVLEFNKAMPSSVNFYRYTLAVLFLASGVLVFIAAQSNYGGGIWSFVGLICVAVAISRIAFTCQVYLQGLHLISPVVCYSLTIIYLGIGCFCLVWGQIRHQRKKISQQVNSADRQATPASG